MRPIGTLTAINSFIQGGNPGNDYNIVHCFGQFELLHSCLSTYSNYTTMIDYPNEVKENIIIIIIIIISY